MRLPPQLDDQHALIVLVRVKNENRTGVLGHWSLVFARCLFFFVFSAPSVVEALYNSAKLRAMLAALNRSLRKAELSRRA